MNGTRNNTVSFLDTYNKLMHLKQLGKARRKAKERAEKPAPRLTAEQRARNYREQNGGYSLTRRQRARIAKKEGQAAARGPVAA